MAYNFNFKFWLFTAQDLNDTLLRQHAVKKMKPKDRLQAHDVFAELYARYVGIVNNLGYLYSITYQVQKRELIKRLLEASTKRLLELRNQLKNLELSEFIYIDKTLVQRKLIPQDVQLIRPHYFPYIRSDEIEDIIEGIRPSESSSDESDSSASIISDKKQKASISSVMDATGGDTMDDKSKQKSQKPPTNEGDEDILDVDQETSVEIKQKARQRFKLLQKGKKAKEKVDPKKKKFRDAVILIQAHERLRRARVYLMNIKLNPQKYQPKPRDIVDEVHYEFMHSPDTPMLILIKRTHYEGNYYIEFQPKMRFNYYISPANRPAVKETHFALEEKESFGVSFPDTIDLFKQSSLYKNFFKTNGKSSTSPMVYEQDVHFAETYFLHGLLENYGIKAKPEPSVAAFSTVSVATETRKIEDKAARTIQKAWRWYRFQRHIEAKELNRKILYGMYDQRKWKSDLNKGLKDVARERYKRKLLFDEQFIKACEDEKNRILKIRGPWIMEDISDHIRAWFKEFYDGIGDFHRYPEEIQGGTLLLVKGETMTLQEFIKEKNTPKKSKAQLKKEAEQRKKALAKIKEKEKREREKAKRKEAQARKRGEITIDFNTLVENENIHELEKAMREYANEWQLIDERNNYKEKPYMEWISIEKFDEVHKELRIIVDQMMRIEYELLRRALAKDLKKKYRPQKSKKKRKGKGRKKKGKGRKKAVKDLTADRSIVSLYDELEAAGVIKKYTRRNFDDFIGDYNFCAYEIRNYLEKDSQPSLGEIKDILREWIIGMGPLNLPRAKSICIAGPDESGKAITLEVLATEIDAVLFDLSPEVVVKYEDNMPYLIHLITKMARILQPTIITIENVHRIFWKKVPKDQAHLKPRLLGKYLIKKILKPIKKEEKILFYGLTNAPWQAKQAKFKKTFDKFLLMPQGDYATAFLIWRQITLSLTGIPRDFEFSPLAMVTRNFNTGDICNNINNVLNVKRRMILPVKPINHMELLNGFLDRPEPIFPIPEAQLKKYMKWFLKVNKLAKQRSKYMKLLEAQRAKEKEKLERKAAKK